MEVELIQTKTCPLCETEAPIGEFGICRARKDGRNLYCKVCVRKNVAETRQILREYKAARKHSRAQKLLQRSPLLVLAAAPKKIPPIDRVRLAFRKGPLTQKEIVRLTGLGKDAVGDILAELLLTTREIQSEIDRDTRMYFIREVASSPASSKSPVRAMTFSTLGGILAPQIKGAK